MEINFTVLNIIGTIFIVFGVFILWVLYSPDDEETKKFEITQSKSNHNLSNKNE